MNKSLSNIGLVQTDNLGSAESRLREELERFSREELERLKEPIKIRIPKSFYDKMSPESIKEKEKEYGCIIVPEEFVDIDEKARVFTNRMEVPEVPDVRMAARRFGKTDPTPIAIPHVKGGRYHEPPRNLKKKKKAKRRQQKQARRRK